MSIASITLVIVGYLVLASLVQPAAERLHLPYAVSSFGAKNARGSADPSPKVMFARDSPLEGFSTDLNGLQRDVNNILILDSPHEATLFQNSWCKSLSKRLLLCDEVRRYLPSGQAQPLPRQLVLAHETLLLDIAS